MGLHVVNPHLIGQALEKSQVVDPGRKEQIRGRTIEVNKYR